MPSALPQVVLFTGDPERYDVRAALHQAGHALAAHGLDDAEPAHGRSVGLFVVDGVRQAEQVCV